MLLQLHASQSLIKIIFVILYRIKDLAYITETWQEQGVLSLEHCLVTIGNNNGTEKSDL